MLPTCISRTAIDRSGKNSGPVRITPGEMASAGSTLMSVGVRQPIVGRNNFGEQGGLLGPEKLGYFHTGAIRYFTYYVTFNWGYSK